MLTKGLSNFTKALLPLCSWLRKCKTPREPSCFISWRRLPVWGMRGQMTVEMAVVFPALICVALIGVNAILFFSECASFDRVARNAIRIHALAPAYEQGPEKSRSLIQNALKQACSASYLNTEVKVEGSMAGTTRFTATLLYSPTFFGLSFKDSVFGLRLPRLKHQVSLCVVPYKPGVLL